MPRTALGLTAPLFAFLLALQATLAAGEAQLGIAAKYPNDAGIAGDAAVLLHDDFEGGKLGGKWDWVHSPKSIFAETDAKIARGKRSLRSQLTKGKDNDNGLWKRLTPGHEVLHMRHYVRYGQDFGYIHHGGSGFCASARKGGGFGPGGHAGRAPKGDMYFWNTLEPIGRRGRWKAPGRLIFYSYWWKMKPDGRGNYWGNWFQPDTPQNPGIGKWTCVEWRVKCNTPAQPDGELAVWIDGVKCGDWKDVNWRSSAELKVNQVSIGIYLTNDGYEKSGGGTTRTLWYDDVVVATEYIGPMATQAPKKKASGETILHRPKASEEEQKKAQAENAAGRLLTMARQAERMGQRDVAKALYRQIVDKHGETEIAKQAKAKLK